LWPSVAINLDRAAPDADVWLWHVALVEAHGFGSCVGGAEVCGEVCGASLDFGAKSVPEPQSTGTALGNGITDDALAWQVERVLVRDAVGPGSCGIQIAATGKGRASGGARGGTYISRILLGREIG
jgi:hypothetical protein